MSALRRRQILLLAATPAVVPTVLAAPAASDLFDEALRTFAGGRPLLPGPVQLDLAPLVENGNAVPVRLWVQGRARRLALLAEGNPLPQVIECELGEACVRAELSTRIRLARSQGLLALAEMADGRLWRQRYEVVVTLAACVEGA